MCLESSAVSDERTMLYSKERWMKQDRPKGTPGAVLFPPTLDEGTTGSPKDIVQTFLEVSL